MTSAYGEGNIGNSKPPKKAGFARQLWLITGIAASIATVAGVLLEHWDTIKAWPDRFLPKTATQPSSASVVCQATGTGVQSGRYLFHQEWLPGSACASQTLIVLLSDDCILQAELRENGSSRRCRAIVDPVTRKIAPEVTGQHGPGRDGCLSGTFTDAVIRSAPCGEGRLKVLKKL